MTVPTKLKVLRGNPGKRVIKSEPEPRVPNGLPDPPKQLNKDAVEEWYRVCPELMLLGLLTVVDLQPLAAYCSAYARWIAAERAIANIAKNDPKFYGLAARNDEGRIIRSPLVEVANQAARDMVHFAQQFGLSPVSRTKLALGPAKPPSKFGALIAS